VADLQQQRQQNHFDNVKENRLLAAIVPGEVAEPEEMEINVIVKFN